VSARRTSVCRGFCGLNRIEHDSPRIGAGLLGGEIGSGALATLQLFYRGSSEGIACRQHDASTVIGQAACELADGGCFPRAIDADDQNDERE